MQKARRVDDVDFPVQFAQLPSTLGLSLLFKHIALKELRFQRSLVPEKLIAELEEVEPEIGAVEVLAAGAVGHEAADVLAEAAAEV